MHYALLVCCTLGPQGYPMPEYTLYSFHVLFADLAERLQLHLPLESLQDQVNALYRL